ncbi:hypothetical protein Pcinc_009989 [Petrolisthes cinctipes]|uniref:Glycosylated lysosomal membrane protein n=1 Tax=Petrolisthes cinctipes TaxID=88211 RepID=A0AAE1G6A0_PETCI|nr:hypothetical protein Pcinc_009989 [Petrolisthes cinctipes]
MVVLAITTITTTTAHPSREISKPDINPDCGSEDFCTDPWLVHVSSSGQNDTIHHLWGLHGSPSFLLAKTQVAAKLDVNWSKLTADEELSVTFQPEPSHVFGLVFPYLILYNDTNDKGQVNRSEDATLNLNMSDFSWTIVDTEYANRTNGGWASVTFNTTAFRGTPLPNDTNLSIKMFGYGNDGRSWKIPKLMYTPTSGQMELLLHRLVLNITEEDLEMTSDDSISMNGYVNPRWALQMVVVSSEPVVHGQEEDEKDIQLHQSTSLDDENSPGVFHLDEMTTKQSRDHKGSGGYLQWRPVSYLSDEKDINDATEPKLDTLAPLPKPVTLPLRASLAYAVLGEKMFQGDLSLASTTVSFGQPGDGFYTESNFTSWTVAVGEGEAPVEGFSTMIIVVISLGVGIPLIIFIVGGAFIGYRKCRREPSLLGDD